MRRSSCARTTACDEYLGGSGGGFLRTQANTCAHTTHASGGSRARNAKYLPLLQAQIAPPHPNTHTHALAHRRRPLNSAFFSKKLFCHSAGGDECRHLFFWSTLFARRSAGCRCLWIRARFFWEGEQTLERCDAPPQPPQPPSQWSISTTIRWLRSNTPHRLHARVNGNYRKEGF